jgi:hypothetical protein
MQITLQEAEFIALELIQQDFPDLSADKKQAVIELIKITPTTIYSHSQSH